MATPRLGLVVEDKPTELSCTVSFSIDYHEYASTFIQEFLHKIMLSTAGKLHVA